MPSMNDRGGEWMLGKHQLERSFSPRNQAALPHLMDWYWWPATNKPFCLPVEQTVGRRVEEKSYVPQNLLSSRECLRAPNSLASFPILRCSHCMTLAKLRSPSVSFNL